MKYSNVGLFCVVLIGILAVVRARYRDDIDRSVLIIQSQVEDHEIIEAKQNQQDGENGQGENDQSEEQGLNQSQGQNQSGGRSEKCQNGETRRGGRGGWRRRGTTVKTTTADDIEA